MYNLNGWFWTPLCNQHRQQRSILFYTPSPCPLPTNR